MKSNYRLHNYSVQCLNEISRSSAQKHFTHNSNGKECSQITSNVWSDTQMLLKRLKANFSELVCLRANGARGSCFPAQVCPWVRARICRKYSKWSLISEVLKLLTRLAWVSYDGESAWNRRCFWSLHGASSSTAQTKKQLQWSASPGAFRRFQAQWDIFKIIFFLWEPCVCFTCAPWRAFICL